MYTLEVSVYKHTIDKTGNTTISILSTRYFQVNKLPKKRIKILKRKKYKLIKFISRL